MTGRNKQRIGKFVLLPVMILSILAVSVVADPINSTQADGMVVYQQLNTQFAKYRTWDETNSFSGELDESSDVGADITWTILKGNHERDEMIMGMQDKANDINIKILSSGTWGNLNEISVNVPNSAYKGFDIEYEDISGDALIVYEDSSADDDTVAYVLWNGTGYSSEQTLTLPLTAGAVLRIDLTPERGSNKIMLLVTNNQDESYAIPWNGSSFDAAQEILLTTGSSTWFEEHLAFAWEETSGQGLVVYSKNFDLEYRTYTPTPPYWSNKAKIGLTDNLDAARMCSDPTSDYIGLIWQDASNIVNVRMWDGTQIIGGFPVEEDQTEKNGKYTANIDCVWKHDGSSALFSFVDRNKLSIDYFNFTKPNSWSTNTLLTTDSTSNFASDDISSLRFTKHPTTEEVMVVAMDILESITLIKWTGSAFTPIAASPIELTTEVINGEQEGVMFDWYKYDPEPNVTALLPSGTNYPLGTIISVNATITDNIAVDTVLANITLPGGSIQQITLNDADNDSVFNGTFSNTATRGYYTIRILANDTSVHRNTNSDVTAMFSAGDVENPTVIISTPTAGTNANQSQTITIAANVTDNINLTVVLTNITFPNGTTTTVSMVEQFNNVTYEYNFSDTSAVGTYNITLIANDTSNNTNSTETTYFTIGDSTPPSVSGISPAEGTNYLENSTVTIAVTVTDNINVSTVLVNITPPNGSVEQLTLTDTDNNTVYNVTTSNTASPGTYNVLVIANDTLNNINDTVTTYFTIGDNINPSLTVAGPADNLSTASSSVTFNFTATDEAATTLNCILNLDGSANITNSSTLNGTAASFTVAGLTDGDHQWNISCSDDTPNTNVSSMRSFTIDTTSPTFTSLTTDPSDAADLDPNVYVTVTAVVTDGVTGVDTVILQRKLSTTNVYTNMSLAFNSSANAYQGTFNASQAGTYNLRLVANDSIGNSDTSTIRNITVELDNTWTRTPAIILPVVSNLSVEVTMGDITINNTGDSALNFTISSDSNTTTFNDSTSFTLPAKTYTTISVNDTPANFGVNTIILDIDATPDATPTTQSSSGTIVVAEGQPIIIASFLTPSEDEITILRGDNNVVFSASVENIGEGNASNVSIFFTTPSDWNLTFGSLNTNFDEIVAGESEDVIIEVSIPSDASTGSTEVNVNTTGYNGSGARLGSIGLAFGDSIAVEIEAPQSIVGGGGGGGSGTPTVTTSSSSGGGSPTTTEEVAVIETLIDAVLSDKKIIRISDSADIMRGTTTSFTIQVTNIFKGTTLNDLSLSIDGYMSNHLKVSPEHIDGVRYNNLEEFTVTITSPEYMDVGIYPLDIILTGTIIGRNINRTFSDTYTLSLNIQGVSVEEADEYVDAAEAAIAKIERAGLSTDKASRMLGYITDALESHNYELVKDTSKELAIMAGTAVLALDHLTEMNLKVRPYLQPYEVFLSKYFKGIPSRVSKTVELLSLAQTAMNRGDYETALSRARDAELIFAIETTQLDLFYLFVESWHVILLLTLTGIVSAYWGYRSYIRVSISRKITDLAEEEDVVRKLIKALQKKRFEAGTIGPDSFNKRMQNYKKRIANIRETRSRLRHKRVKMLSKKKVISDLEAERIEVINLIEKIQRKYFVKRVISKNNYDDQKRTYVSLIAEIANERLTLETKVSDDR